MNKSIRPGHEDRAWHVAWNPTKPILTSCSADKNVRLYTYSTSPDPDAPERQSLKFAHITTIPTGHAKTVRALAWSPSGNTLATASFDSNIGVWAQEGDEDGDEGAFNPAGEWECMSLLEGHETECKSVAYSSSGNLLASCSRDKTVWIWEGAWSFHVIRAMLGGAHTWVQFTPITTSSAWASSWSIHKMSRP